MTSAHRWIAWLAAVGCTTIAAAQSEWVDYVDETDTRAVVTSSLFATDTEEKDYGIGDFDQDGDDDLLIMRKEPFTTPGRRRNLLLMNEGIAEGHAIDGVLVNRTVEYASAADDGGDGMIDATNDRDVAVFDANGDEWPDFVTAVTLGDNLAKTFSHPRLYMNLGEDGAGNWLGFEYQEARIPQLAGMAPGGFPHAPRFCSVSAGDIDNDGDMDLYFGDYDQGVTGPPQQTLDFNNRLLINDGDGNFTDQTVLRLNFQMYDSNFAAASGFHDFNGDGAVDILKHTALSQPYEIAITYNTPGNPGFFASYDTIVTGAPYFASAHDTTGNGDWYILVSDDGPDLLLRSDGLNGANQVEWVSQSLPATQGFGGDNYIRDLNNDGVFDLIVTDVDVDVPGCDRATFWIRGLGNHTFSNGDPVIPGDNVGIHNIAFMDIDGDGWLDAVVGGCDGSAIYMNQPPDGLGFAYPDGLDALVSPGAGHSFQVNVAGIGSGLPDVAAGAMQFVSVNDGPFVESPMPSLDTGVFLATLPTGACLDRMSYYFEAVTVGGELYSDPPGAPVLTFSATVAEGIDVLEINNFEDANDNSGWTVQNDPSLTSGAWERVTPNGTLNNALQPAAPDLDNDAQIEMTMCWVTENAAFSGEAAGLTDVDGGPTHLISPIYDLEGIDGIFTFARWMHSSEGPTDTLRTWVTGNGTDWTEVADLATSSTGGNWQTVSFQVGGYITPTSTVQVRWSVQDTNGASITDAGIDTLTVDVFDCGVLPGCFGDTNGDDVVDVNDLVNVITDWNTDGSANGGDIADNTGAGDPDGIVDVGDLVAVITAWGECS